jgi:hypothetical protein
LLLLLILLMLLILLLLLVLLILLLLLCCMHILYSYCMSPGCWLPTMSLATCLWSSPSSLSTAAR